MTLMEKLNAKVAKDEAAALKAYRDAAAAAASGQDLPQKRVDEVADALATLRLTPADFAADVEVYRTYLLQQSALDALPSRAEIDEQVAALMARQKAVMEDRERLRVEQAENHARIMQLSGIRIVNSEAVRSIVAANPRLFPAA